ncbi:MAG: methylenetetrahydrofolate reductase [Xanthobacteraceae bacterium]|nr:methylenetetrahydrofolate reductase [Xanthobacteraceae bacterium]
MLSPHRLESVADAPDFHAVLNDVSMEAVMPGAAEIHEAASALPTGTSVYLTDLPNRPEDKLFQIATGIFMRGLKPVPHVAARNVSSENKLADLLLRLSSSAGVKKIMLIGGDRDRAAGPFEHAIEVLESGILERTGITEIGIAAYPEGHPNISEDVLRASLRDKLEAAERIGLKAHIVTQFCFDAWPVVTWLRALRASGISNQVRIGMAGPASIPSLMKFAQRCGVRASAKGFARHASSIGKLLTGATPAEMVNDLAEAAASENLGEIAAHFYSFGGLPQAAKWVRDAKDGKIE